MSSQKQAKADYYKTIKSIGKRKSCMHPDSDNCSGRIIKAHTVSKSSTLKNISVDGHVLNFDLSNLSEMNQADITKYATPKTIGINSASTFTGFCAHHDQESFLKVDEKFDIVTKEIAFLLSFRAYAREIYAKMEVIKAIEERLERETDADAIRFMNIFIAGNKKGLEDLSKRKGHMDKSLMNQDYSDWSSCSFCFQGNPVIASSGGFLPEFDFAGNSIQNLLEDDAMNALWVNIIPQDDKTFLIFFWHKSDPISRKFVQSFYDLDDKKKGHSTIYFAFEHFENIFMSQPWWDSLRTTQKKTIFSKVKGGMLDKSRQSDCLIVGTREYVDWQYDMCSIYL